MPLCTSCCPATAAGSASAWRALPTASQRRGPCRRQQGRAPSPPTEGMVSLLSSRPCQGAGAIGATSGGAITAPRPRPKACRCTAPALAPKPRVCRSPLLSCRSSSRDGSGAGGEEEPTTSSGGSEAAPSPTSSSGSGGASPAAGSGRSSPAGSRDGGEGAPPRIAAGSVVYRAAQGGGGRSPAFPLTVPLLPFPASDVLTPGGTKVSAAAAAANGPLCCRGCGYRGPMAQESRKAGLKPCCSASPSVEGATL